MAAKKAALENQEIGDELLKLAELLYKHGHCKDISPITTAGYSCRKNTDEAHWTYTFNLLCFEFDSMSHAMPRDMEDLKVLFSIGIKGLLPTGNENKDNLLEYCFNIDVSGIRENKEEVYCHWHLDKDIPSTGITHYSHPLYHFTLGGKKIYDRNYDCGMLMILPTPRFAYPPMDGVLGIDFILQNYLHRKQISKLLNDSDYKSIVNNSQRRLWQPYYNSIVTKWNGRATDFDQGFQFDKLLPFLS